MPFSDQREQFTHDSIRRRLLQHIMQLWGVRSLNHLDPFVRLLMETLANELNKISNEFIDSEVRVLDKLAALLTPDLLTVPRPAHAVVQAQPVEASALLAPEQGVHYVRRYASRPFGELDSRHDVVFGPVDTVRLVNGHVALLAAGTTLWRVDETLGKLPLARAGRLQQLPPHTLYLGLHLHPDVVSLDRLGFYFDWPDYVRPDSPTTSTLYTLLGTSGWLLGDRPLDARPGLAYGAQADSEPPAHLLAEYEIDRMLEDDVKTTYYTRFMHLRLPPDDAWRAHLRPYPAEFAQHFPDQALEGLSEPLLWLRVQLPASFDEAVLSDLTVAINAFPVMNRQLHHQLYRTRIIHNILPLRTEPLQTFLTVRSLTDSRNRPYTQFPFREADRLPTGCFAVRRGGVERFDARDAREHLHYLLEVLRDEAVAFASFDRDDVLMMTTQLNRQIEQLTRKVRQYADQYHDLTHYLLFQPHEEGDTMDVAFWTTDCAYANNVRAGTRLQPFNHNALLPDQTVLLTTTTGGQDKRQGSHQLDAYKYALMSRQRVVTTEDIKAFVTYEMGALIDRVEVRKGVAVGIHAKEGLMRTVDIWLRPAPGWPLDAAEWDILREGLRAKLLSRSGQVGQYRIFLEEST